LDEGGYSEPGQADQQGPSAGLVRLEGVVDLVRGVVGVPTDHLRKSVPQSTPPARQVFIVLVLVPVLAVLILLVEMWIVVVAHETFCCVKERLTIPS
jgi:hypothetical protein